MKHRIAEQFSKFWARAGHEYGCCAPEFGQLQYNLGKTEQVRRNMMEFAYRAGYAAARRALEPRS